MARHPAGSVRPERGHSRAVAGFRAPAVALHGLAVRIRSCAGGTMFASSIDMGRARQLRLFDDSDGDVVRRPNRFAIGNRRQGVRPAMVLCRACRAKEARYGFRDPDLVERPGTLCFECFRLELERRQRPGSPRTRRPSETGERRSLAQTLEELSRRRRRAQIAARRALDHE
jgi:hypothetical protein